MYAIETVDSIKKATKLNDARKDEHPILNVFIQINTSGESNKNGVNSEGAESIARHIINNCPKLKFLGLMTIGSVAQSQNTVVENQNFKLLVEIKKHLEESLSVSDLELSMGMSQDFMQAIRQGSTNVRVGSSIFGARPPKQN